MAGRENAGGKRSSGEERREKGAVGQKACGSVNEQSSAGGKRAKRALIRSALPAATARWVGIGCGVGSRGGD